MQVAYFRSLALFVGNVDYWSTRSQFFMKRASGMCGCQLYCQNVNKGHYVSEIV